MTNSDFLAEVYGTLDEGQYGWVCAFAASPDNPPAGVWSGRAYTGSTPQAAMIDGALTQNTYFCTAILSGFPWARQKTTFHALGVLVADDIDPSDVIQYSYAIQTSPGKHQVGILLDWQGDPDCSNRDLVDKVMMALATRGRTNDRSGNACVRYVRLPCGSNTKPRAAGTWTVQMVSWNPSVRWNLADACHAFGIDLDALKRMPETTRQHASVATGSVGGSPAGEMLSLLAAPPSERSYHESLTRLAASLIGGGMFPGAAVDLLYSLMDQVRPSGPAEELARWESRRAEIPRAVKSAEKFAPEERKPPSITVNLSLSDKPAKDEIDGPAPMDWAALQGTQPEAAEFTVPGWLPRRTTTLLSANGGVGKSNLSLQLAVSVAVGASWLGLESVGGRVLVVSAEDEARTVHFRVANVCADLGVSLSDLSGRLMVYDMTGADCVMWRNGGPTAQMQWLADAVVRHKADVVIVDNASDVFASNENDRAEVRGFMRCLNSIAHGTGAAVLLLAHVDKASVRVGAGVDTQSTFSGSTAWNNSARSRWAMTREDQAVMLRHEKCNLGPLQDEIKLEFDPAAKVFRSFGSGPVSAALTLVRNVRRAAILKLMVECEGIGQRLSLSAQSNNNAFRVLSVMQGFPGGLNRAEFFSILRDFERDGLAGQVMYQDASRKRQQAFGLTDVGRMRAAQGSGAPGMWRGGE